MKVRRFLFILCLIFGMQIFAFPKVAWGESYTKSDDRVATYGEKTRMLIVLNCSKSMWDGWQSDAKIKVTQQVLLRFLDSIGNSDEVEVALRVFGHLNKGSYSTKLEVPFEPDNHYKLQSKIKTLVPNGGNTTASALTESLNDFPKEEGVRNIIVIITDGIDDSEGDICQVARRVQLSGIVVQTFILGIGNPNDFRQSLDCAGKFTYLPDEADYTRALYDVFRRSEAKAQVVVELKDEEGMPVEGVVPIAFYDAQTGVVRYSEIYGVGEGYESATLEVDPLVDYEATLFTHPEMELTGLHFETGRINRLMVTVPEGTLRLKCERRGSIQSMRQYEVMIRRHTADPVVGLQKLGEQRRYIAGRYDVDVLSMPVLHFKDVEIQSNKITEINIPYPGTLNLSKPKEVVEGALFVVEEGRLHWVCDLNANVQAERMELMPGEYEVVYRGEKDDGIGTVSRNRFNVESGKTTSVTMKIGGR